MSTNGDTNVSYTSQELRMLEKFQGIQGIQGIQQDTETTVEYYTLNANYSRDPEAARSFMCAVVTDSHEKHIYVGFIGDADQFNYLRACIHLTWNDDFSSTIGLNWLGWHEECCAEGNRPMEKGEMGTVLMAKAAMIFASTQLDLGQDWTIEFMDTSKIECKLESYDKDDTESIVDNVPFPEWYALTNHGQTWYQAKFGAFEGSETTKRVTEHIRRLLSSNVDEETLMKLVETTEYVSRISGNSKWYETYKIKYNLKKLTSFSSLNSEFMNWDTFFSNLKVAFKCSVFSMFLTDIRSIFPDWLSLSGTRWKIGSKTVQGWAVDVDAKSYTPKVTGGNAEDILRRFRSVHKRGYYKRKK